MGTAVDEPRRTLGDLGTVVRVVSDGGSEDTVVFRRLHQPPAETALIGGHPVTEDGRSAPDRRRTDSP
jgi:hypothetical protein